VLTRVDGDGRGGAALSMRAVTGKPIKFIGTGEKADALEEFQPSRIANRILGMGDIVSLVEKAAEGIDAERAQQLAARMKKGSFDLDDLAEQLRQMEKIGGMSSMLGLLPGIGKVKRQIDAAGLDDSMLKRQRAIISSMTREERKKPDILKASRKRRIAAGSGTSAEEINKLLKMHRQMADVMKAVGKDKGMLGKMMGGLGGMFGGGAGAAMPKIDPEDLARLTRPGAFPGLGGGGLGGLGGLPGLGGGGPKLPGLPGGAKKK
jgi:signal recognition particle subunit SRP54